VPVRVDRVGLERVRIDEGGVGAVHGDAHVPHSCVNLDTTLSFGRDSLGRQLTSIFLERKSVSRPFIDGDIEK
jgi:hypothetical protein